MMVIQSQRNGTTILLPNPLFGDEVNNVQKTKIKYSMLGSSYSLNKTSSRRKYKYSFDLSYAKARELVDFYDTYSDYTIRVDGGKLARFVGQPHEVNYGIHSTVDISIEEIE